jgi:hypothetical protein
VRDFCSGAYTELFVVQKAPGQKISPLFSKIIQGRFSKLEEEEQVSFRDALKRYVTQYSFVSQISRKARQEINYLSLSPPKFCSFFAPARTL